MLRRGFMLIEILVVCAIIGVLVAILLPSLARSREQASLLVCQANERQLASAFLMYSVANRNRLPGILWDFGADWLGGGNATPPKFGRIPQDGTIFQYMGRQAEAYACPMDHEKRPTSASIRSYSAHFILAGARPESLAGAHYRWSDDTADPL